MQPALRRTAPVAIATFAVVWWASAEVRGQPPAKSDKPAASGAEVQSRGEHKVREISFSDWQRLCFEMPDGKRLACRTTTTGTWEGGQTAVRLDLIEGDNTARLQMFLPTGLYLQTGVTVAVDKAEPVQIPYTWCFPNGCIAAGAVKPELIRQMESGRTLVLGVVDSNVLTVNTAIPLDRFAPIRKGPPAQTFDRGLNTK